MLCGIDPWGGEGEEEGEGEEGREGSSREGESKREGGFFLNFQLSQNQIGAGPPGCTARSIDRTKAITTSRRTARKTG